jgi:hypothetical protein
VRAPVVVTNTVGKPANTPVTVARPPVIRFTRRSCAPIPVTRKNVPPGRDAATRWTVRWIVFIPAIVVRPEPEAQGRRRSHSDFDLPEVYSDSIFAAPHPFG